MLATRILARLDVKPSLGVVKGRRMEGLRVVGDPHELAVKYAEQGADEILYLDITASLYGQPAIHELVSRTARDVYVPLTVGGGVRTLEDVLRLLRAGADKIAINTAALARPKFITEIAAAFGSQCVVVSVEAKDGKAMTNAGRDDSGWDVDVWISEAVERGAGEILVTDVGRDGTLQGLDDNLLATIAPAADGVPLVVSGGFASPADAVRAIDWFADAVAIGKWLHDGGSIAEVKAALAEAGVEVREGR